MHRVFFKFMEQVEVAVRRILHQERVKKDPFQELLQYLHACGELRGQFADAVQCCVNEKFAQYGEYFDMGDVDRYAADVALCYKNIIFLYCKVRIKQFRCRIKDICKRKRGDDAMRTRLKNQCGGSKGAGASKAVMQPSAKRACNAVSKPVTLLLDHVQQLGGAATFLQRLQGKICGEGGHAFLAGPSRAGLHCLLRVFGGRVAKNANKEVLILAIVEAARKAVFQGEQAVQAAMDQLHPWLDSSNNHQRLTFKQSEFSFN